MEARTRKKKSYKRKDHLAEDRLKSSDGKDSLNARQKYYEKSTFSYTLRYANEPAQIQMCKD